MKPILPTLLLAASIFFGGLFLSSCANSGAGSAAGDGTYRAPAPVSSVEATDQMRSQYREMR